MYSIVWYSTEDRGQRTEDRGQRTEDKGQRTEDRGQRFPAGPEGPFQPSAGARRRVSVGHPNLLVDKILLISISQLLTLISIM